MQAIFDEKLETTEWHRPDKQIWQRAENITDDEIRGAFLVGSNRLVEMADRHIGVPTNLDPKILTIGFARRFATYKRADLLLRDRERILRMINDPHRPVQFVFAGKAHPADEPGKELLANIASFAEDPAANGRFVFVPGYDMAVSRAMYAGCDVWLNNPIRPREASGTSGEKAALNGVLNCSILDGWWDEGFDGENGWAIESSAAEDPEQRDHEEANNLYDVLENEVIPLYYGEDGTGPSTGWLDKVRHNWKTLGPFVTASRMLEDYSSRIYQIERSD